MPRSANNLFTLFGLKKKKEKEGRKAGKKESRWKGDPYVYDYVSLLKDREGYPSRLLISLAGGRMDRLYEWRLEIRGGDGEKSTLRSLSTCRSKINK